MSYLEQPYLDLLADVLENGEKREDRTGTGTLSVFGRQMRFDLRKGFPLLTTKKVPFRLVAGELEWFLSGSTNVADLIAKDIHIWDDDAYRNYKSKCIPSLSYTKEEFLEKVMEHPRAFGDLGPIYGKQWRSWEHANGETLDQIHIAVEKLKKNPFSRQNVVSAWNAGEIPDMALPPCHTLFQFYVNNNKELSCQLYQRSGDLFLGVPFNIASYALLTHIIAKEAGLKVGEFVHTIGDAHLYLNHVEAAKEQLSRTPFPNPPQLWIKRDVMRKDPADYRYEWDYGISGYEHHPAIKAPLSVGN